MRASWERRFAAAAAGAIVMAGLAGGCGRGSPRDPASSATSRADARARDGAAGIGGSAADAAGAGGRGADTSATPAAVVLITVDTLRADRVGAYGWRAARTPAIDALAARGVRLARAFAPAPITLPSHASLLTGLNPPRHGARHNGMRLAPGVPTLAERLCAQGFATAAFIAAFPLDRRFGLDRGFDTYGDLLPRGADGKPRNERPGSAVVDEALAWIAKRETGQSFFLWVHLFEPHAPYEDDAAHAGAAHARADTGGTAVGEPQFRESGGARNRAVPGGAVHGRAVIAGVAAAGGARDSALPAGAASGSTRGPAAQAGTSRASSASGGRSVSDRYDAEIARADAQIARLVAALEPRAASTLFIVTADHGEAFGEHGEIGHSLFVYDTTLRVPLVFAGPSVSGTPGTRATAASGEQSAAGTRGRVIHEPVSLVDVVPTVLDLLHLRAAGGAGMRGTSGSDRASADAGAASGEPPGALARAGVTTADLRNAPGRAGAASGDHRNRLAGAGAAAGDIRHAHAGDARTNDAGERSGAAGDGAADPDADVAFDGVSLAPLLAGGAAPAARAIYAESFAPLLDFGWSPLRALRQGGEKYIAAPKPELYDVARDPAESRNLLAERAASADALAARIDQISPADIRPPQPPPSAASSVAGRVSGDAASSVAAAGAAASGIAPSGGAPSASAARSAADRETEARLRSLGYLASSTAGNTGAPAPPAPSQPSSHATSRAPGSSAAASRSAAGSSRAALAGRVDPKDRVAFAARIAEVTSGELQGAALRRALEALVKEDPRNGQMQMRLGVVLQEAGDCRGALPHYRAAIAASVPSADPHLGLAECLAASGDADAARRALVDADRLEPGNPIVSANLGLMALEAGRTPEAIVRLRAALDRAPDLHPVRFALARAYGRAGQRADAAREARELLTRLPANAPQRGEVQRLLAAVQ